MLSLSSCRDMVVCAAFQSTYILDDSLRHNYYSLFLPDSTPKESPKVNKNKFGIIKKDPMWVKNYKLKTAPKENIYTPEPEVIDSLNDDLYDDELYALEDSTTKDEFLQTASAKNEKRYYYGYKRDDAFNRDMEYYVKYFGYLMPDERPIKEPEVLDSMVQSGLNFDSASLALDSAKAERARLKQEKKELKAQRKQEKKNRSRKKDADQEFELFNEELPSLEEETEE